MSSAYGRLAAIRDYWMPRDQNARAEVRVTDLDAVLTELARLSAASAEAYAAVRERDAAMALLRECRDVVTLVGCSSEGYDELCRTRDNMLTRIDALLGPEHDGPGGVVRWPHDSEGTPT